LTTDPGGFLYIADTGNHRIQKLDSNGSFVTQIGGYGWEKEQFDMPLAVSARNGLDVFVADFNNQRIERYDKDLHYLASFYSNDEQPEHLHFGYPRDVDLSNQGELFCLDGENLRILKLDIFGEPQISFGGFDAGQGRLENPKRFFISASDRLYVSDSGSGRIMVFDVLGNYLLSLGEKSLINPYGIVVTENNLIVVADLGNKQVFVFQDQQLIGTVHGGIGFEEPVDVACWRNRIYVLDRKASVVHLFEWKTG
jgi:DNA-binding beta-propeller fold protein YncE